jgi:hypothetical protein
MLGAGLLSARHDLEQGRAKPLIYNASNAMANRISNSEFCFYSLGLDHARH